MTVPIAPGVFDIIPQDDQELWRSSYLWNYVEEVIRKTARDYGYLEIRTPMFERTELFKRGVGETSDIVSKEMYTFKDKGDRSISLRPEGTAPVIRAFVEHQLQQQSSVHKLFYIAPMFRYERTQAGRYRQHHQFGVEAIGNKSPEQDVEVIDLLLTLYQRLGLKNLQLCLNSLGDAQSRMAFRTALQDYLRPHLAQLSADSQNRFENNPLRILDSKDPADRKLLSHAPSILDFLNSESKDHFELVQKRLDQLKIPYTVSPQLVRGLDYYNHTVFEIIAGELGAQNSIGGGGRYDGLMKQLGGQDLPTIGFGTGIERIIQTILKQNVATPNPQAPYIFLIALGGNGKQYAFDLLHELRRKGISATMDFGEKKLNKSMQQAHNCGAKFVAVIGEDELNKGKISLKEMSTGEVTEVPLDSLERILNIEMHKKDFLRLWKEMSTPFANQAEADFFIRGLSHTVSQTLHAAESLSSAAEQIRKTFVESD